MFYLFVCVRTCRPYHTNIIYVYIYNVYNLRIYIYVHYISIYVCVRDTCEYVCVVEAPAHPTASPTEKHEDLLVPAVARLEELRLPLIVTHPDGAIAPIALLSKARDASLPPNPVGTRPHSTTRFLCKQVAFTSCRLSRPEAVRPSKWRESYIHQESPSQ